MRKFLSLISTLPLMFAMTSCTAIPKIEDDTQQTAQIVSGTIQLQAPEPDTTQFPGEYPSATVPQKLDNPAPSPNEKSVVSVNKINETEEVRAIWFSFLEFQNMLTGRTKAQFEANIGEAFDRVKSTGFNTVFVHVRPHGDALYASKYYPWSSLMTGTEGKDPGFDPLTVMIQEARKRSLRVEAWVNPYRVRTEDKVALSDNNPAKQWIDAKEDGAIRYNGGVYYNPASEKARALIVNGVREIVEGYDVDGIHFDDYFYPTTSADFDKTSYDAYKAGGGTQSLENWRRENVNVLVREVYRTIKQADPTILFGISPQGNNDNNYNGQFIDTAKWLANEGYIDYICPQVYFGFKNEKAPFKNTVEKWETMAKKGSVKLYIGMAPYKLGGVDQWAGIGKNEWVDSKDLLAQMIACSREQSTYGGFAMFRYDFLFEPTAAAKSQITAELRSIQDIL